MARTGVPATGRRETLGIVADAVAIVIELRLFLCQRQDACHYRRRFTTEVKELRRARTAPVPHPA